MSTTALDQIGVQYRLDRRDEEKVKSILLPFTAEQFMDVCDRESHLLPMCCGNISQMRDIVTGSLREGGWLEIESLETLIQLMQGHDFEDLFQPSRVVPRSPYPNCLACHKVIVDCGCDGPQGTYIPLAPNTNPWLRIVLAWEALEDCAVTAFAHNPSRSEDPTDLRDACYLVSNSCYRLWVKDLFHRENPYDKEQYPSMSEEERASRTADEAFDHAADTTQTLLRAVPAIHTLYTRIKEAYPDPVEGWCATLINRPVYMDAPDIRPGREGKTWRVLTPNILTDSFGHGIILVAGGLAIYRTPEKLEQAIRIWEVQHPKIREDIVIKRVRVSITSGIEILGGP